MAYNPMTQDQYMQQQKNIINPTYFAAQNRLTEQYNAAQPTFQQGRNAADVYAAQSARQTNSLAAMQGRYGGGRNRSNIAGIYNQAASRKSALDRDQAQYQTQYGNRLNELNQARAGAVSQAALGYDDYSMKAEQLKQALAAQQWQRQFAQQGFTADEAYRQWQQQYAQQQEERARMALFAQMLAAQGTATGGWPDIGMRYGDYMKELLAGWR